MMKRVSRGKFMGLNAELLAEVFSFLPSEDLAEVMLVSKHWERSATEGSGLCRRVTVARAWEMGGGEGKGHNFMCKLLAAAKEVEFRYIYYKDNGHIESLGGVLGSNLQFLTIPYDGVSSAFLTILVSQCPHLKTLVMDGEPKGRDPIDIRHPQLETLMIACGRSRVLTIDCPNLTHLSTGGTVRHQGFAEGRYTLPSPPFPSFNCPRLTDLLLSPLHSTVAVWEFLAAHATNIKWLEVRCHGMNPFTALTGIKALQALRVKGSFTEIPPHFDFGQWPLLEGILLDEIRIRTDLEVRHAHLKELRIVGSQWEADPVGYTSVLFDCPSFEKLWLNGVYPAKNLDSQCPRLKSLKLQRRIHKPVQVLQPGVPGPSEFERLLDMRGLHEIPGLSEFVHETVKEIECRNLLPQMKRIVCPKLTKLVLGWERGVNAVLAFPILECPSLLRLELCGYVPFVSSLPSILAVLPDLETLEIDRMNGRKEIVLEHPRIKDLVTKKSRARSLVLIMPSLVHVDIGRTELVVMKVSSMEKTITVDFSRNGRRRRVFRGGGMRI